MDPHTPASPAASAAQSGALSWPPETLCPPYRVEELRMEKSDSDPTITEEARLVFDDWLGRPVSIFARRSYPVGGGNGGAVLHIVGGAQTIHPGDLSVWTGEGYAAASFDWQITGVGGRPPERTSRFPEGVVAQNSATPTVEAAVLPIAVQAAAVCLDWLSASPGVAGERLGVVGISWGGYLSWLLAAYDARVRVLVPAFGCGGLYGEGGRGDGHAPEVRAFLARYFDPAALGEQIRAPVCFLNGTNDFFGDVLVAERLLKQLNVPVVRSYLPNVDHSLSLEQTRLAKLWVSRHLFPENASAFPGAEAPVEMWWAEADGESLSRCWLPGAPPADRDTFVLINRRLPGGAVVSDPLEMRAGAEPAEESRDKPRHGGTIPFGLGWRWEVGSTRHFSNEAQAISPSDGETPWQLIPARPSSEEPLVLLIHFPLDRMKTFAQRTILLLGWLEPPNDTVVKVSIHERSRGSRVHEGSCMWKSGAIELDPARFETLSPHFRWSEVGRLVITALQNRREIRVGPFFRPGK